MLLPRGLLGDSGGGKFWFIGSLLFKFCNRFINSWLLLSGGLFPFLSGTPRTLFMMLFNWFPSPFPLKRLFIALFRRAFCAQFRNLRIRFGAMSGTIPAT